MKELVTKWPPSVYRTAALVNDTLNRLYKARDTNKLDSDKHFVLLSTLAQLYIYERSYDKALDIYLKLRDKTVFQTIDRYQLFRLVKKI